MAEKPKKPVEETTEQTDEELEVAEESTARRIGRRTLKFLGVLLALAGVVAAGVVAAGVVAAGVEAAGVVAALVALLEPPAQSDRARTTAVRMASVFLNFIVFSLRVLSVSFVLY